MLLTHFITKLSLNPASLYPSLSTFFTLQMKTDAIFGFEMAACRDFGLDEIKSSCPIQRKDLQELEENPAEPTEMLTCLNERQPCALPPLRTLTF